MDAFWNQRAGGVGCQPLLGGCARGETGCPSGVELFSSSVMAGSERLVHAGGHTAGTKNGVEFTGGTASYSGGRLPDSAGHGGRPYLHGPRGRSLRPIIWRRHPPQSALEGITAPPGPDDDPIAPSSRRTAWMEFCGSDGGRGSSGGNLSQFHGLPLGAWPLPHRGNVGLRRPDRRF